MATHSISASARSKNDSGIVRPMEVPALSEPFVRDLQAAARTLGLIRSIALDTCFHSNIRPALHAAGDRDHPSQECAQDRDDHTHCDLIRLQPLALPF